jgi:hypothetical protein
VDIREIKEEKTGENYRLRSCVCCWSTFRIDLQLSGRLATLCRKRPGKRPLARTTRRCVNIVLDTSIFVRGDAQR